MKRFVAGLLTLCCLPSAAHAVLGRDDQWTYVAATPAHGARAELRGDHPEGVPSQLIFQIECEAERRALIFRYFYDGPGIPLEPMELIVSLDDVVYEDDISFRMPTRRSEQATLEGRLPLNDEIATAVRDARYMMIYAPNDMGEPLHAGEAPALRRLTRECWERSVG